MERARERGRGDGREIWMRGEETDRLTDAWGGREGEGGGEGKGKRGWWGERGRERGGEWGREGN